MFKAQAIDVIYLHPSDNVCVAARDLAAGTRDFGRRPRRRTRRAGPAGS